MSTEGVGGQKSPNLVNIVCEAISLTSVSKLCWILKKSALFEDLTTDNLRVAQCLIGA